MSSVEKRENRFRAFFRMDKNCWLATPRVLDGALCPLSRELFVRGGALALLLMIRSAIKVV